MRRPKSQTVYILLALFFFGLFGFHNFYARRFLQGVIQLIIALLLGWFIIGFIINFVWLVVEVCTVTRDGDGQAMN